MGRGNRSRNRRRRKKNNNSSEENTENRGSSFSKQRKTKEQKKQEKIQRKKEAKMGKRKSNFLSNVSDAVSNAMSVNNYYGGGYGYNAFQVTRPTDGEEKTTLNLAIFSQKFLNDIAAQCVPVAGGAEFQTHYRCLQVVIGNGQGRVVFTIPTVFFNFPQTVSTGSVDFDLREVDTISAGLKEKSNELAMQIANVFPKAYFEGMGFNVSFREGEVGSIHRHPGDFSFSSIDLDKDPTNPGVIYRQGNAKDVIQTDSVLYIQGGNHVKLVTTQTRVVNVEAAEDGGVAGTYDKAKTIAMIYKDSDTTPEIDTTATEIAFDQFFIPDGETEQQGVAEVLTHYLNRFDGISQGEAEGFIEHAAKVMQILISNNYTAINKIDPNLIKPHYHSPKVTYSRNKASNSNTKSHFAKDIGTDLDVKDMMLNEVLDFLNIEPSKSKITEITDEEVRTLFWNCAGNKSNSVTISCSDGTIKSDVITKTSVLIKVTFTQKLAKGTSTSTRYIQKGNGNEYIIEDKPEITPEVIIEDDDESNIILDYNDASIDLDHIETDGIDTVQNDIPDIIDADATKAILDSEQEVESIDTITEDDKEETKEVGGTQVQEVKEKKPDLDEVTIDDIKKLFKESYGKQFTELTVVNQFQVDGLKKMLLVLKPLGTEYLRIKTENVEIFADELNDKECCIITLETATNSFPKPIDLSI